MKKVLAVCFLLVTQIGVAQPAVTVAQRVTEDAIALDRVAQASKRDLPTDLLRRIVDEDIELLRGKRQDGSYEFASFERFDSGRIANDFSVQPNKEEMRTIEMKGDWVYRLLVEVPSRRMLVRKNRPVWVERVDLEYIPERSTQVARETIEIKQWLQPGEFRPVDLPQIARQATARVVATSDPKGGYGNLIVALIKARIVDNANSPYADAVASAKAIQRALENNDVASIRSMAQRMRSSLGGSLALSPSSSVTVVAPRPDPAETDSAGSRREMQSELQTIEDLLTGTESERREGMDRLHQLIRRLRQ